MNKDKSIHFQIAELTVHCTIQALRNASYYASKVAIESTNLENPLIYQALSKLEKVSGDLELQTAIEKIAEELDDAYLYLQDSDELGKLGQEDVIEEFNKARAATTVALALNSDARKAAHEAIYETYHIVEDRTKFLSDVQLILKSEPS